MPWPKGKRKSVVPIAVRLLSRAVRVESGCLLWIGSISRDGYGMLRRNKRTCRVHCLSYMTFVGPIPGDLQVCHRCDVPCCINPEHLFLGTNQDNQVDSLNKGRYDVKAGEKNGRAKLTDAMVREIRRRLASGESQTSISRDFPEVNRSRINAVCTWRTWKHVTMDGDEQPHVRVRVSG